MYTIVQFSPTGNTKHLANLLSEHLDSCPVYALEHTDPKILPESDHLIIMYAIHAFNAPSTVKRFAANIPPKRFNKISLIGVGCNDNWVNFGASDKVRKLLEKKSYPIIVDSVIAMPLTFVLRFPEAVAKAQIEKAHKIIPILAEQIKKSMASNRSVPVKSQILSLIGRIEPLAARFFGLELYAKKSCIACGKCVLECPEGNVKMNDEAKIKFGFKCIMCMRCIYNCPVNAITPRISKFIPHKNGYSVEKYLPKEN